MAEQQAQEALHQQQLPSHMHREQQVPAHLLIMEVAQCRAVLCWSLSPSQPRPSIERICKASCTLQALPFTQDISCDWQPLVMRVCMMACCVSWAAGNSRPISSVVMTHLRMQEFGDQHQPEPSLPSAEEVREQVALGEMAASGVAAAPAGSLGHLMLVSARPTSCCAPSTQGLECCPQAGGASPILGF